MRAECTAGRIAVQNAGGPADGLEDCPNGFTASPAMALGRRR
jgi:hypothetical protein